jgi:hypothetical protein
MIWERCYNLLVLNDAVAEFVVDEKGGIPLSVTEPFYIWYVNGTLREELILERALLRKGF